MHEYQLSIIPDGPNGMPVVWVSELDHDQVAETEIANGVTLDVSLCNLGPLVGGLIDVWVRHGSTAARAHLNAVHRRRLTGRPEPRLF